MIFILIGLIVTALFYAVVSRKTILFLNVYGLGMSLIPIIQMTLYPDYKLNEHYRDVVFIKVLIDIVFLLFGVIFLLVKKSLKFDKKTVLVFSIYLALNIPAVVYSERVERSLLIYIVTIFSPIIIGLILSSSSLLYPKKIIDLLLNWIGLTLIVKYGSIIINGFRHGIWNFSYGGYDFSLIRGNSIVSTFALITPLFVTILLSRESRLKWKIISLIAITSLILSGSRMGFVSLIIVFFAYWKNIKAKRLVSIITFLTLINLTYFIASNQSLIEFFIGRFTERGSLEQGATEDGRILIWANALDLFFNRGGQLIGLGNFSEYSKYSNAHNLFLNHLIERGVLGILSLIILLSFLWRISSKNMNSKWLKTGIFIFLLVSITGEDLFNVSRVVHGFTFYVIIFLIVALSKGGIIQKY